MQSVAGSYGFSQLEQTSLVHGLAAATRGRINNQSRIFPRTERVPRCIRRAAGSCRVWVKPGVGQWGRAYGQWRRLVAAA